jgi:hypothetical protein
MGASGRADQAPRPGTAARAHRQSVDRGEGHGGGEAAAAVDRAQLAPLPRSAMTSLSSESSGATSQAARPVFDQLGQRCSSARTRRFLAPVRAGRLRAKAQLMSRIQKT